MHVTALHLHPVKGCHRVEVDAADVGPYGLTGDRRWQVVRGEEFITQRTHPRLALVRPALAEGGVVLRADGLDDLFVATPATADTTTTTYSGPVQVGDGGDDAAAWFTRHLGEPVRLVGIAPGYARRFADVFATELALGDAAPLLVIHEASHRFLEAGAVEPFGIERWRANVIVDGGEAWDEDGWRTLRIGDATVQCVMPWPRCAVPQVDQEAGTRHREPALVLKRHRWCPELPDASPLCQLMLPGNPLFGMACSVEPVGASIAVGDAVEVLATGEPLLRT